MLALGGAAISQWIPHASTGSNLNHTINVSIVKFCTNLSLYLEKDENKQKEAGFSPYFQKFCWFFSVWAVNNPLKYGLNMRNDIKFRILLK